VRREARPMRAENRRLSSDPPCRYFGVAGCTWVRGFPLSTTRVFTRRAGVSPTFLK
jgi:hypothetical protein